MKITCVPHGSHRDVFVIEVDEEPRQEVHAAIFGKKPKLPLDFTSLEEFDEAFAVLEYRQAKQYVIRRLAAQQLPSTILADNLRERLVSEPVIEQLLEEFRSLGYINDEEWIEGFIRRQLRRKLGPRAIAQKLAVKGLKEESVEMVETVSSEESQKELIQALLTTKYVKRNLSDAKERQKVVASLARRGFSLSVIFDCINVSC